MYIWHDNNKVLKKVHLCCKKNELIYRGFFAYWQIENSVIAMETLLAPVSFCQKTKSPIYTF